MKKLLLTLTSMALLLLGSCTADPWEKDPDIDKSGNKIAFTFKVDVPEAATRSATVPYEPDEADISSIILLFFEPSHNQSGLLVNFIEESLSPSKSMDLRKEAYVVDLSKAQSDFDPLSATNEYEVLVIANMGTGALNKAHLPGAYRAMGRNDWIKDELMGKSQLKVMEAAKAYMGETVPYVDSPPHIGDQTSDALLQNKPGNLLMHAIVNKPAEQQNVNVVLKRNMARFDVEIDERVTDAGWELVSVSIWNAQPNAAIFGESVIDYSGTTQPNERYRFYGLDFNGLTGGATKIVGSSIWDGNRTVLPIEAGNRGLYVYPNQIAAPLQYDKVTTALLLGFQNPTVNGGTASYFRVNIHLDGSPQHLRENFVYNLIVTGIPAGGGAANEFIAWSGRENALRYMVNAWYLDDNRLTVQDDYSTLGVPTKVVRIGSAAQTVTYDIVAYNSGGLDIAPTFKATFDDGISVKSFEKATDRENIWVLTIETTKIEWDDVPVRRGVINFSYAGLENSMSFIQSGAADKMFEVIQPNGGIPVFPVVAGGEEAEIKVISSGPWTARLYVLKGGAFTLAGIADGNSAGNSVASEFGTPSASYFLNTGLIPPGGNEPTVVTGQKDVAKSVANIAAVGKPEDWSGTFKVKTLNDNLQYYAMESIIVVSLDSDPDHYSSTIIVTQKRANAIKLYNNPPGTTANTNEVFNITPSPVDDKVNAKLYNVWMPGIDYPEWQATIYYSNADDIDKFGYEYVSTPTGGSGYSTTANQLRVWSNQVNCSGRDYKGTLVIYVNDGSPTDYDPSKSPKNQHPDADFTEIPLLQKSIEVMLKPTGAGTFGPLAVIGGTTQQEVEVTLVPNPVANDKADIKWNVKSFEIRSTQAADGRRVAGHDGWLHIGKGASKTKWDGNSAQGFDVGGAGDTFTIELDKVYYPNRDLQIIGVVTVSICGGAEKSITVNQAPLVANNMTALGMNNGNTWGRLEPNNLTSTYFRAWHTELRKIPTWSVTVGGMVSSIPTDVTYLHHVHNANNSGYNWDPVTNYINNVDAFLLLHSVQSGSQNTMNAANSPLKRAALGPAYPNVVYGASGGGNVRGISAAEQNKKIFKFVIGSDGAVKTNANRLSPTSFSTNFHTDGVSTYIPIAGMPTTANVIMTRAGNAAQALMVVDVTRKMIWIGESQMFDDGTNANRGLYLENIMYYVANAAKYGSHFTDMFLEAGQKVHNVSHSKPMDPPWHNRWDATGSGGTDNRGVPTK